MKGKPAERIPKDVIRAQSLNVDTVSGATISSRAILAAIADALSRHD
jgi:urocanate reductase